MKKILLGLVMSTFAFALFAQTNLMVDQNGGFEGGNTDHWRVVEINADGAFFFNSDSVPALCLSNFEVVDDPFEGDKALKVTWPPETTGLAELLIDKWDADKFLPVTAGNTYIFKANAYATEGAGNVLRIAYYFFGSDSVTGVAGGDIADQTWILGDFYEEHVDTVVAPADAMYVSLGFRCFGHDGTAISRWPATQVVTVIDNIQFWENYDPTAVDKNPINQSLRFYPNPVENNLQIISESAVKSVCIYNIAGQRVKEVSGNVASINVEDLAAGVYIIKMDSETGSVTQKLLKK